MAGAAFLAVFFAGADFFAATVVLVVPEAASDAAAFRVVAAFLAAVLRLAAAFFAAAAEGAGAAGGSPAGAAGRTVDAGFLVVRAGFAAAWPGSGSTVTCSTVGDEDGPFGFRSGLAAGAEGRSRSWMRRSSVSSTTPTLVTSSARRPTRLIPLSTSSRISPSSRSRLARPDAISSSARVCTSVGMASPIRCWTAPTSIPA